MYKVKEKEIIFYERNEVKKINAFDIILFILGVYIIFAITRNGFYASYFPILIIQVSFILGKYVFPIILKKYNIRINRNRIILENKNYMINEIYIKNIIQLNIVNDNTVKIDYNKNKVDYSCNVFLDKEDINVFIENLNIYKNEYRNRIKNIINNAYKET